jgi:hypothetical protein
MRNNETQNDCPENHHSAQYRIFPNDWVWKG